MKKYLLFLLIFLVCSTGCSIKRDDLEDVDIYTTIYPIEYITERLYGEHSEIHSIYPNGVNVHEYELTDKLIKDYSAASLVIFNGLSKEKDYVLSMYDKNNDIKIIDSTLSMEYTNSYEEMWLDPLNYLMMIQNIRTGFKQYITNQYLKNEIEENYETLKLEISSLDAKYKLMAENASDKNIVVTSDLFKFLEKYGLNVYSLQESSLTEKTKEEIKNLINSGKIKYIFAKNDEEISETVKSLAEENKIEILYLHTLVNLNDNERENNKDYVSIMNENLNLLKQEVYE